MNANKTNRSPWLPTCALGIAALSASTAAADEYVLIAESDSRCRLYIDHTDLVAEGCNLHIRDGTGSTVCVGGECNGKGNLIVGYDSRAVPYGTDGADKSGSHNLVVGDGHAYRSFGGVVAGYRNHLAGPWSTITGGEGHRVFRSAASVSGGSDNIVNGDRGSIAGGSQNYVGGRNGYVAGGQRNEALGQNASVVGGVDNVASGADSTVSGGRESTASGNASAAHGGYYNEASGAYSSVSGGAYNEAEGQYSVVSGGAYGGAHDSADSVFGGNYGYADGGGASVLGGESNDATGVRATVCGGRNRVASGLRETVHGGITTMRVNLPRNDGSSTTLGPYSELGPYTVSFGMTLPCSPIVFAQMYNSGSGQTAPFLVSIEEASPDQFKYHLINTSARTQSAYTGSIQYTAMCP